MQLYFGPELKFEFEQSDTYRTERTDDNYQDFRITFSKDLEFI